MKRELIPALALAVCVAGCGRSSEEAAQERAAQAAEGAGQAAQEAGQAAQRASDAAQDAGRAAQQASRTTDPTARDARGLEDMAKALGALARTASGDGKAPFPLSTATARYTRGDARIEVKMTDSVFNRVGKRYVLQIEGRNIEDPRALHEVANRLDMGRLAALQ